MRRAISVQPEWLGRVPTDRRLPEGRVLYTGCGTSFHAAQTGGAAMQALELVLAPQQEADLLVAVSHEGDTPLTVEAARAFAGPVWLVTAKPESPLGELAEEVLVATPEVERSWCHTVSYTCAVATLAALRGDDVSGLPAAVETALQQREPVGAQERYLIAGAGRDWPTAQEAALKLREGAFVAAEAHETEQLLHGHLAAIDESVRAFVIEGEGRAAERAAGAVQALRELGCETTLVPSVHPVVDIVRFQLLTLDLAEARGVDPDKIRRDDERWDRARAAYDEGVSPGDPTDCSPVNNATRLRRTRGPRLRAERVTTCGRARRPAARPRVRAASLRLRAGRSRPPAARRSRAPRPVCRRPSRQPTGSGGLLSPPVRRPPE